MNEPKYRYVQLCRYSGIDMGIMETFNWISMVQIYRTLSGKVIKSIETRREVTNGNQQSWTNILFCNT